VFTLLRVRNIAAHPRVTLPHQGTAAVQQRSQDTTPIWFLKKVSLYRTGT